MILASLTLIPVWGDFQLCHSSRLTPAGSYSIVSLPAVLRSLRATWPELELSYHACAVALLQYSSDGRPAAIPPFIYTDANGEERNIQFDQLPQIDSFDALHCWFGDRRPSVTSTFIKWTAIQRSLGKPVPKYNRVLYLLLPDLNTTGYCLRQRRHDRILPSKTGCIQSINFLTHHPAVSYSPIRIDFILSYNFVIYYVFCTFFWDFCSKMRFVIF